MSRGFIFLLFVVVGASCHRKVNAPLLTKQQMVNVLVDIHVLEAQFQTASPFEKGRSFKALMEYDKIFRKNGVAANDFFKTFDYYKQHPKEMDELYQAVVDEAARRQSEANRMRHLPNDTARAKPAPQEEP